MLAMGWPLSSVGVPGLASVELDVPMFWDDLCLRQLYVDRVIARGDTSRLNRPEVRLAVMAALGAEGERVPAIARALREGDSAA
jgi:hypothetical protein